MFFSTDDFSHGCEGPVDVFIRVEPAETEAYAATGIGIQVFVDQGRAVKTDPDCDIEVTIENGTCILRIHALDIGCEDRHMVVEILGTV